MTPLFDANVLPFPGGEYRARISYPRPDRTDADTIPVLVDLGCEVYHALELRIRSLYCAERNTEAGKAAIAERNHLLSEGDTVRVKLWRTTVDTEQRSFARYIGDIWYLDGVEWRSYQRDMDLMGHGGQGQGSRGGPTDA